MSGAKYDHVEQHQYVCSFCMKSLMTLIRPRLSQSNPDRFIAAPVDKFNAVYIILFIEGIGMVSTMPLFLLTCALAPLIVWVVRNVCSVLCGMM